MALRLRADAPGAEVEGWVVVLVRRDLGGAVNRRPASLQAAVWPGRRSSYGWDCKTDGQDLPCRAHRNAGTATYENQGSKQNHAYISGQERWISGHYYLGLVLKARTH